MYRHLVYEASHSSTPRTAVVDHVSCLRLVGKGVLGWSGRCLCGGLSFCPWREGDMEKTLRPFPLSRTHDSLHQLWHRSD